MSAAAVLRGVALAAVLTVSARFEYGAGTAVGLGDVAPAVPVMVDAYAMSALLAGRDVRAALALLWVSITTGALHLALTVPAARHASPGWVAVQVVMAVVVASIAAGVMWRVDTLYHADRADRAAAADAAERAAQTARDDAHAADLARVHAETERVRAETERVRAERARPARPATTSTRARTRTPDDDLTRRRALHDRWAAGEPMSSATVAAELDVTPGAARALIHRWAKANPDAAAAR